MKGTCVFRPLAEKEMHLTDVVGRLMDNITDRWLLTVREADPAILAMFGDSDIAPQRDMLPWSGEFAGKYLTGAVQICSMTKDSRLFAYLHDFVDALIALQKPNGYLGPWPEQFQLTGRAPVMGYEFDPEHQPHDSQTWDAWAHYHVMYGLLRWYQFSGDEKALRCVCRIADLFCRKFFGQDGYRLWDNGDQDMNLAPIHSFTLLYELTGEERYLTFAHEVEKDFEKPPAGDYIRCALAGQEFWQMPKPRWESLHAVQGIAELYLATGDGKYKEAFTRIWRSILSTDVHNTGGFSSREQAVGDPYNNWAIETCCVIAYMAATVDMLRLTGDVSAADMLEWATYNAGLGSFSPSGRWSTYNTPMEGYKRASHQDIGFQCRPGSPDLNCCSVNAPRAFGMITDWGYMTDGDALIVNWYGEGTVVLHLEDGTSVTVSQHTGYPYDGTVRLRFSGMDGQKRAVRLRIPFWSYETGLVLDGEALPDPQAGTYYTVERTWHDGDELVLTLDFSLRFSAGEKAYAGKASVYRGPLLLCFDPHFDRGNDFTHRPALSAATMAVTKVERLSEAGALFYCTAADGGSVVLCDLYTAGLTGSPYTTWSTVADVAPAAFSFPNIQRIGRP